MIRRNYVCRKCGTMRRAFADYLADAPPAPKCCDKTMQLLSYEQTVAATRLKKADRINRLTQGGEFARSKGKRRWKADKKSRD